ncbi:uncharacterized protein EKO05_0003739 [Ascochyta rabiei]|uniref:uncharacterized protein n=1 Tax=Didymella rabiei TaxID=5454 RepID=UPI002200F200|nr:uncharacterized protein EKO05_0003739 [Ascochyta rabiei]UPX13218.1 hypothetical protein EKO05_0003739 [Ascochyta rabiei]
MKYTLPVLGLTALASALPQTTSPPPSFKITNVISGGTGCPRGSIDVNWTDHKILPIYFGQEFTAAVGPKANITDSRKFCQLNLQLEYTPGYSFAVYSAEYTGFAALDAGVTGTVKSTYYFSGLAEQTSSAQTLSGPTRALFNKQDDVAVAVWSPCSGDALFNVDASVALTPFAGPASGVLGIARESGRLSSSLYVQWKKC